MPWEQVECHPSVKRMVRRSIENNQFSQTTLIYGPSGAGQEAAAEAVAMTLICSELIDDFCGICEPCRKVKHRKFADVFFLQPPLKEGSKTERKMYYEIDQIREMQKFSAIQPYQSDKRVFVISNAHRMNVESANCLLKLLEEPFPHNYFVLYTDNITGMLTTILSRCRRIRLAPLSKADFIQHADPKISIAEASVLSRIAGGLPQQALELHESGYFALRDELLKLIAAVRERETAIASMTTYLHEDKDSVSMKLQIFLSLLRDAVLTVQRVHDGAYFHQDRISIMQKLWQVADSDRILDCFEKTLDAIESKNRFHNMNIVLADLVQSLRRAIAPH